MKNFIILTSIVMCLGACNTSTDPGQGGFINGLSAIKSGIYEKRSAELVKQSDQQRVLQAQLRQDLAELNVEYARLQELIRSQRNALASNKSVLPVRLDERVNNILGSAEPVGDVSRQLKELKKSIAAARALTSELAKLS